MTKEIVSELTEKQRETVGMLASGYTSKHIAAHFGISPQAVDRRVQGLLRKTGCASRGELVRWHLQRSGLCSASECNLGDDPDRVPSSISEQITANMDQPVRIYPQDPAPWDVASFPETHTKSARPIAPIDWLGMEVTWLQAILMLMILREAYEILS